MYVKIISNMKIEEMYNQENDYFKDLPNEPEVFNLKNKVTFSVKQLKEFSEEFANRVFKRGNEEDLTGFWSLCKEMFYEEFKNS